MATATAVVSLTSVSPHVYLLLCTNLPHCILIGITSIIIIAIIIFYFITRRFQTRRQRSSTKSEYNERENVCSQANLVHEFSYMDIWKKTWCEYRLVVGWSPVRYLQPEIQQRDDLGETGSSYCVRINPSASGKRRCRRYVRKSIYAYIETTSGTR